MTGPTDDGIPPTLRNVSLLPGPMTTELPDPLSAALPAPRNTDKKANVKKKGEELVSFINKRLKIVQNLAAEIAAIRYIIAWGLLSLP